LLPPFRAPPQIRSSNEKKTKGEKRGQRSIRKAYAGEIEIPLILMDERGNFANSDGLVSSLYVILEEIEGEKTA
jgi:C4-type Zn-finger protein